MSCNLYSLRDLFNIYIWDRIHRDRIHWDQIYRDRIYRSPLRSSKILILNYEGIIGNISYMSAAPMSRYMPLLAYVSQKEMNNKIIIISAVMG